MAKKGRKSKATSKYFGVGRCSVTGKWRAQINRGGKYIWLGLHVKEITAAKVVQDYLKKHNLEKKKTGPRTGERPDKPRDRITAEMVAETLKELDGPMGSLWMCCGCGAEYTEKPERCIKCGGFTLEKIKRPATADLSAADG